MYIIQFILSTCSYGEWSCVWCINDADHDDKSYNATCLARHVQLLQPRNTCIVNCPHSPVDNLSLHHCMHKTNMCSQRRLFRLSIHDVQILTSAAFHSTVAVWQYSIWHIRQLLLPACVILSLIFFPDVYIFVRLVMSLNFDTLSLSVN